MTDDLVTIASHLRDFLLPDLERTIRVPLEQKIDALRGEMASNLMRFHQEVVIPEIEYIVDSRITALRNDMLTNFDALWKRFDRLESEYYALKAGVERLEKPLQ